MTAPKRRKPSPKPGRPRVYESEPLVTLTAKVSKAQKAKFRRLQMSARLRAWIDRAKE